MNKAVKAIATRVSGPSGKGDSERSKKTFMQPKEFKDDSLQGHSKQSRGYYIKMRSGKK